MKAFNPLSLQILESKYYAPGETSPQDVFTRVAKVVSIPSVLDHIKTDNVVPVGTRQLFSPYEHIYDLVTQRRGIHESTDKEPLPSTMVKELWQEAANVYFEMMDAQEFMPGTPTLINAGRPAGMLSSCFALRIPDSLEGIFQVVKDVAIISKAGGGVGLDVSELRPAGATVKGTRGTSSGPISFLKVFDMAGQQVKQGGIRRAALLAGMRITHPDVINFIRCKKNEGDLSNFNISVFVTDEFMNEIKHHSDLPWICTSNNTEYVISKKDGNPVKYIPTYTSEDFYTASDIWNVLVRHAWENGEPGVIFEDELNRGDIFKGKYGKLLVNPCGELPLISGESCNLGAINLLSMWDDTSNTFDYIKLKETVKKGVNFLDDIIDVNMYPLEKIEQATLRSRKIGLGVMGLHDVMLKSGVHYGSPESLDLIDKIFGIIKEEAKSYSEQLSTIRGIPEELSKMGLTRRNGNLLTIQPTGTVSIICNQASSSIEPVFQWEYTRKDSYGTHEIHHFMKEKYGDTLPDFAKTALEISPQDHVAVQAQVQKYIDQSISKTVNLPNGATVEEVDKLYKLAYKSKCKSITIYRSGSRKQEVLNAGTKDDEDDSEEQAKPTRERPRILYGATYRMNTPGGKAYITVNEDREGIREVFIHISKAGSETGTHIEAEGRLISNSLKRRVPADEIIEHLEDHKSNPIMDNGRFVKSVPDAVAIAMKDFRDNLEGFSEFLDRHQDAPSVYSEEEKINKYENISGDLCPDCGNVMYMASGCSYCSCGFSKCG